MTLALIGGTGLSRMQELAVRHRHDLQNHYGKPSAPVVEGDLDGMPVLFLARHGDSPQWLPHQVNYRANMRALKDAGASAIIAVNVTGGITVSAGTLVIPDQIIDYTWGRENTLFDRPEDPLVHVEFSRPFDDVLRQRLQTAVENAEVPWHDGGCYAATQGPRLETAAEVRRLEQDGCDIVGMTGMPEAVLARELAMPYAMLSLVVNPAAGKVDHEIDMAAIEAVLESGMVNVRRVLTDVAGTH